MPHCLQLDNICCEIDERVLFAGLSQRFHAGDLVQIVGPNGAGKTTLLRILTGLSQHYRGKLRWDEHPVPSYEFFASLLYLGHQIGVNPALTALENLQWYFGLHGVKGGGATQAPARALHEALTEVGLAGYEDVPAQQMSAGQQRRVALARLYVSQAPLWVLDEPFTAIDKQGVSALEALIQRHREGGGLVLLTTHQSLYHIDPQVIDLADYAEDAA